jgi:methylglutamate dehydrogenase subunit D
VSVVDRKNTLIEVQPIGVAAIMARKHVRADAIGRAIGLLLPFGPTQFSDGPLTAVGNGPGTWLMLTRAPRPGWTAELAVLLSGLASISDQSGAYALMRLAGPDAGQILQRGALIDLHPNAFTQEDAATTAIAHIGLSFWRSEDTDTFEIAVPRSFAGNFRRWFDATSAAL